LSPTSRGAPTATSSQCTNERLRDKYGVTGIPLIPVRWSFGVGHESKIPLKVTAAFFGVFVVLFLVSAYAAGVAEAKARKTPASLKVPGQAAPAATPGAVNSSVTGQ